MRILIVEDDPFKLGDIRHEVTALGIASLIEEATSLQEATCRLEEARYDAVLLDMAIPSHEEESGSSDIYSQPVGGLDILLELASADRPERVIIITQYPTVEYDRQHVPLKKMGETLLRDDVTNVIETIRFDEEGKWKGILATALGRVK